MSSSPLEAMAAASEQTSGSEPIITITPEALEHLTEIRDDEADRCVRQIPT
jgi:hypothetical protein